MASFVASCHRPPGPGRPEISPMCGRFTLTTNDYDAVACALQADFDPVVLESYTARFNVAPTDMHWIACLEHDGRELVPGAWRYSAGSRLLINARSETVHERPAFSNAFWNNRCVVPADGFFEWTGPRKDRRPMWFHRPDRSIFAFAGLYQDHLDAKTGEVERRFTILTTQPNALVGPIHDRMPVILSADQTGQWLDVEHAKQNRAEALRRAKQLFIPVEDEFLEMTAVSKRVGDPHNDDPSCLEPPKGQQGTLF